MKFIFTTALVILVLGFLLTTLRSRLYPAATKSFVNTTKRTMAAQASSQNLQLRPFNKLGVSDEMDWLLSRFHMSFADYYDPNRMNWGALRVWNDDEIKAHKGFGAHPHRDMEIITYVTEGAITHQDSMGNKGRTEAGDVQVMAAGTGVIHSEQNLEDKTTKLFQLWIMPKQRGRKPSWGARKFPKGDRSGKFVTLASGFEEDIGDDGALEIHTDSRVAGATINKGQTIEYNLGSKRMGYLVPARGSVDVNGVTVNTRDGLAIQNTETLKVTALEEAEVVLVDTVPL